MFLAPCWRARRLFGPKHVLCGSARTFRCSVARRGEKRQAIDTTERNTGILPVLSTGHPCLVGNEQAGKPARPVSLEG